MHSVAVIEYLTGSGAMAQMPQKLDRVIGEWHKHNARLWTLLQVSHLNSKSSYIFTFTLWDRGTVDGICHAKTTYLLTLTTNGQAPSDLSLKVISQNGFQGGHGIER